MGKKGKRKSKSSMGKKAVSVEPNILFPGKKNYTGPTAGWFFFVHHRGPILEYSKNIMERVRFIRKHKVKSEIPVRLNHLVHCKVYYRPVTGLDVMLKRCRNGGLGNAYIIHDLLKLPENRKALLRRLKVIVGSKFSANEYGLIWKK
jgi:hypothetical protein